jgi:hypothetical protein
MLGNLCPFVACRSIVIYAGIITLAESTEPIAGIIDEPAVSAQ